MPLHCWTHFVRYSRSIGHVQRKKFQVVVVVAVFSAFVPAIHALYPLERAGIHSQTIGPYKLFIATFKREIRYRS